MMRVTGNIFVQPVQIQSAINRLLPSLEAEIAAVLTSSPQASTLTEKVYIIYRNRN